MASGGRVVVTISANDRTAKGIRTAERRFEGLQRSITALNVAATVAFVGIVAGLKEIIDASSDLVEATNKAQQVFVNSFSGIEESAENAATAVGLSTQAFLESTATLGNLLVAFGLTEERAAGLSDEMVTLASDLASFNNVPVEEALNAIRAALVGESEPIRRFGADVRELRLQTIALELGLTDTRKTLTASQRAFAAYEAILRDATKAQGDFQRTSGELANQLRIAEAQIKDAAAELGESLLPLVRDVVVEFNEFIQTVDFSQLSVQLSNATKDFINFFNQVNSLVTQAQSGTLFGGRPLIEILINDIRVFPQEAQILINDIKIFFLQIKQSIETGIQDILSSDSVNSLQKFFSDLIPEGIARNTKIEVDKISAEFNKFSAFVASLFPEGVIDNVVDFSNTLKDVDAQPAVDEIAKLIEANKNLLIERDRIQATPLPGQGILDNVLGTTDPRNILDSLIPFRDAIKEINELSELLTIEAIDKQDLLIDLQTLGIQADNFAEAMAGVNKELEELTLTEIDLEEVKTDTKEIEDAFKKINDQLIKVNIENAFKGEALQAFGEITNTIADSFVNAFNIANTAFGNLVSSILRQATALAARLGALSLISLIPGVGSFASLIRLAFDKGGIVPQIEGFQAGGIKTTDTVPSMLTPGEAVIPASSVQNNRNIVDSLIASPEPLQSTFSPVQQSSTNINIAFNGFDELSAQRVLQSPEFQNTFADIINNGDLKIEVEGRQVEVIR